jgi:hypothetical protein
MGKKVKLLYSEFRIQKPEGMLLNSNFLSHCPMAGISKNKNDGLSQAKQY